MTQMVIRLMLVALALGTLGPLATAQEAIQGNPAKFIYFAPVKFVSGEVIEFTEPRPIVASGRLIPSESALLLKTALAGRILAQFPAAQAPELHLNEEVYPVFRQESSNWDMKAERPVNPEEPVAQVEFLYFLIPSALAEGIDAGARAVLRANAPPSFSAPESVEPGSVLVTPPEGIDLVEVPGSIDFRREIVIDD